VKFVQERVREQLRHVETRCNDGREKVPLNLFANGLLEIVDIRLEHRCAELRAHAGEESVLLVRRERGVTVFSRERCQDRFSLASRTR